LLEKLKVKGKGGPILDTGIRAGADAGDRPADTFPVREHHRPLAGTKLYCMVTQNNLPVVVTWWEHGQELNPLPLLQVKHP